MLSVSVRHDARELTFFLPRPALEDALPEATPDAAGKVGYRLLNQTNGQAKSVALPESEAWSLLSVSPWRDKDGNLEAAGRWVSRARELTSFAELDASHFPRWP